jgi:copper homeostasis protein
MRYKLEVIGFTIESCIIAQSSGAHRIELCDNPGEGGTTPSYGFIKAARKKLSIGLYPIIRPRGGDFFYSDDEFEIMKSDVTVCKKLGCDGIVIGILNADGTIDKQRSGQLIELAYPLGVTFHRAFDRTIDPFKAMEDIIETGCERILTSGQRRSVADGMDLVAQLIEKAEERIIIMPGSGLRADNIRAIAKKTKATEFHTSARVMIESKMEFSNEKINEELKQVATDEEEIKKMVAILDELEK